MPSKDPVWSGLEVVIFILFTFIATVAGLLVALAVWALAGGAARGLIYNEMAIVSVTLVGQTAGFVAGVAFAWRWITRVHQAAFWRAVHWRRLAASQTLTWLLAGVVLMIAVQLIGQVLPIPPDVPMDRLFTPRTAWILAIYGVGIAPFFEEFFFRGLIYPSLKAAFTEGMQPAELRSWRLLLRCVGGLGGLVALAVVARYRLLHLPLTAAAVAAWGAFDIVALVLLLAPGLPLAAAGWAFNRLARLQRADLLAIVVTGILFGLMHATQLGWAWAAVLILIVVGMVLTWVRAASGSVMASWVVHCAYNGTLFVAQYLSSSGFQHFTLH